MAQYGLRYWKAQSLYDFAGDGEPTLRTNFSTAFSEFIFRQQVNHVTANSRFPVETVGCIQDDFVLLRLAIEPCRSADERIHVFEIIVYTPLFIRNDDRRMRRLFPKRKKIYFPLPHFTILRTDLAASLLDSLAASWS